MKKHAVIIEKDPSLLVADASKKKEKKNGRFIKTNALESAIRPMSLRNEKGEQFATRRDLWERKVLYERVVWF